ncbi:MAG TPA: PH domain-containing protein [Pyrinomonadaceae bacterium]|nr:PH domain-containing protein [Pyrinomonadaceae bacterium]
MHCTNCGTFIAPGTRFCAGCGAPAVDPEATRYAGAQQPYAQPYAPPMQAPPPPPAYNPAMRQPGMSDAERQIFKTRPTLLFIKIGYALAALGGIILVILLAYTSLPTWISIVLALALLLIPAYHHLKRNMLEYTLTNHKLEIDEGFFSRTTRNFTLRNIQDVTVRVNLWQRILGYGDVIIEDASEGGGTTVLHNIQNPRQYADMILRELRQFR